MKRILIVLEIGLWLSLSSAYASAQSVPSLMNFQGQVLAANGSPLATGDYDVTFQIFDAAEGGTLIWGPQVLDGTGGAGHGPRIPVVQGYFNVMLGPVDTAARPLIGAFLGATRFLEIKVGTNNPISPRQQILSAPYALNSANAASVSAGGVSTLALADDSVSTVKLNDSAVTSNKIASSSIGASKLAQEVLDRLLPAGTVVTFGGSNAPAGWLLCDGSVRSGTNAAFNALFAAIGKTYGPGDGTASSFNLPDLRGRTVMGAGQGSGLSNRLLAVKVGTETEAVPLPLHTHTLNGGIGSGGSAHSHNIKAWLSNGSTRMLDSAPGTTASQFNADTDLDGAHTHSHTFSIANAGTSGASVNNLQPSIVLNYIIKL